MHKPKSSLPGAPFSHFRGAGFKTAGEAVFQLVQTRNSLLQVAAALHNDSLRRPIYKMKDAMLKDAGMPCQAEGLWVAGGIQAGQ